MTWHVYPYEVGSAQHNQALDQAIYEHCALRTGLPAIRFYGWDSPAISLGAYQELSAVHLDKCKENHVQLVRRMTGGSLMLHSTSDVSFCAVVPIRLFNYSIATVKRAMHNGTLIGLKQLGMKGTLHQQGTAVQGKLVVSSAGKALENGFYVLQGSVHVRRIPDHPSLTSRELSFFSWLEDKNITDTDTIYQSMRDGLTKEKNTVLGTVTSDIQKRVQDLAEGKYASVKAPEKLTELAREIR